VLARAHTRAQLRRHTGAHAHAPQRAAPTSRAAARCRAARSPPRARGRRPHAPGFMMMSSMFLPSTNLANRAPQYCEHAPPRAQRRARCAAATRGPRPPPRPASRDRPRARTPAHHAPTPPCCPTPSPRR
jgi:hypothetical protein